MEPKDLQINKSQMMLILHIQGPHFKKNPARGYHLGKQPFGINPPLLLPSDMQNDLGSFWVLGRQGLCCVEGRTSDLWLRVPSLGGRSSSGNCHGQKDTDLPWDLECA